MYCSQVGPGPPTSHILHEHCTLCVTVTSIYMLLHYITCSIRTLQMDTMSIHDVYMLLCVGGTALFS